AVCISHRLPANPRRAFADRRNTHAEYATFHGRSAPTQRADQLASPAELHSMVHRQLSPVVQWRQRPNDLRPGTKAFSCPLKLNTSECFPRETAPPRAPLAGIAASATCLACPEQRVLCRRMCPRRRSSDCCNHLREYSLPGLAD